MIEKKARVYVLLDNNENIVRIEGQYTLPTDLTDWVLIEEGDPCDRLNLAQTHYFEKSLYDNRGIPRYKYVGGECVCRTDEEMDADYEKPAEEPTQLDRIEAQMMFTALMTDTLLEV